MCFLDWFREHVSIEILPVNGKAMLVFTLVSMFYYQCG
jgi:hypothetical protein